jgi:hypothetical protein
MILIWQSLVKDELGDEWIMDLLVNAPLKILYDGHVNHRTRRYAGNQRSLQSPR